jgi:preprotein translocase subunit Sec61beta
MAKQNKVNLPSGGAGITRYFDEYKSKIEFQPGHVIFLAIIVIAIVMILHLWGNNIFF